MMPFQLLTGVKMRTKQDLEILKQLEEEIVETFTENRENIREEAKRNILKTQEENCRNFNKKFSSGLHGKKKNQVPLRTAYGQVGRCGIGSGVATQLNLSTKLQRQNNTQSSRAVIRLVAAVAKWYRYRTVACFVTGSSPVPLKTRRVGQRCTLNLSRAETSSRWCGVVVRRGGASSGVVHVT
ncbi:uncharacterized protein TNCV_3143061 [Trichonephila clavipes]|nr:uncharacterized protein TNCV_3143061 [Trichonephila clavipes]